MVFFVVSERFWERLGVILGGHFGYLFGLCEKGSTFENVVKVVESKVGASENDKKASQTPEKKRYENEDKKN